jgi:hypothetical protein
LLTRYGTSRHVSFVFVKLKVFTGYAVYPVPLPRLTEQKSYRHDFVA